MKNWFATNGAEVRTIYHGLTSDTGMEKVNAVDGWLKGGDTPTQADITGRRGEYAVMRALIGYHLATELIPAGCRDYRVYQVGDSGLNLREVDIVEEWQLPTGERFRRCHEVKADNQMIGREAQNTFYQTPLWAYTGQPQRQQGTGNIYVERREGGWYNVLKATEDTLKDIMTGDGYTYTGRYLWTVGLHSEANTAEYVTATVRKQGETQPLLTIAADSCMFVAVSIPVREFVNVVESGDVHSGVGVQGKTVNVKRLAGLPDFIETAIHGGENDHGVKIYGIPLSKSADVEEVKPKFEYRWTNAGIPLTTLTAEEYQRVKAVCPFLLIGENRREITTLTPAEYLQRIGVSR